jgi:hypothetical protein
MFSEQKQQVLGDKRFIGLILFGMLLLFPSAVAFAQSTGVCTRTEFVSPVSLYGGRAAGLAVDGQDNLYIAENENNWGITPQGPLVSKVTPQGARSILVPEGVLGGVTALAFDGQGILYVADDGLNGVWKVDCGRACA